jgi:putative transcriptional regulator
MKLCNLLKLYRVKNGDLTQQDLAEKVKVSRQTINSIEAGKKCPSVDLAIRLAKALKVKVEDLFFYSDKEN